MSGSNFIEGGGKDPPPVLQRNKKPSAYRVKGPSEARPLEFDEKNCPGVAWGRDGNTWNWLIHKHVWWCFLLPMFADKNFPLALSKALVRLLELKSMSFSFFGAYVRKFQMRVKSNQNRWHTFLQFSVDCISMHHQTLQITDQHLFLSDNCWFQDTLKYL